MTIRASFLVAIAVALGQSATRPQTPALVLPEVAAARFESGALIRVPAARIISQIEVRLDPDGGSGGRSTLMLDDDHLRAQRFTESGRLVLAADTRESRGLFVRDEQHLRAQRIDVVTKQLGEWRILRWKDDTPYIEASRSTATGTAPDLLIDEPKGGAFVYPVRPARIEIEGRIAGQGDFDLRIAGRDVKSSDGADGRFFSAEIDLSPDMRDIEVAVLDRHTGASRQLLLPIIAAR